MNRFLSYGDMIVLSTQRGSLWHEFVVIYPKSTTWFSSPSHEKVNNLMFILMGGIPSFFLKTSGAVDSGVHSSVLTHMIEGFRSLSLAKKSSKKDWDLTYIYRKVERKRFLMDRRRPRSAGERPIAKGVRPRAYPS